LRGKKVGIIGLGHIGIEIAKRLQAFEMKILALKRRKSEELQKKMKLEFLGEPEDLDYLLSESDFVIVIAPLTPATRGMIGDREIRLMKPSAYIINVARAAIIEEEPLYQALKENRIAGAALDVWWVPHWWDPKWKPELNKPSKFPFWELPNVITTPHNIGYADFTRYSENSVRIMAENIGNIAKGKPPINQVDKEHQY
jgi:phosphoglycerate dehydrogenase-like enzyme